MNHPHGPLTEVSPNKAHRLLEAGPVLLVATAHEGRSNVMTMGFHMMVQHDPPLIGAIIGPWDHSFAALKATASASWPCRPWTRPEWWWTWATAPAGTWTSSEPSA